MLILNIIMVYVCALVPEVEVIVIKSERREGRKMSNELSIKSSYRQECVLIQCILFSTTQYVNYLLYAIILAFIKVLNNAFYM